MSRVDLARVTPAQLAELSDGIAQCGAATASMEGCARDITRYLYDSLGDGNGGRACALVRCFKTQRLATLPVELQKTARASLEVAGADSEMKCLVLLGTVGTEPDWNSRHTSVGHQAIPLPSARMVARFPMISQLMKQLGVDVARVLDPSEELIMDLHERTYNVFFVDDAQDSPYIPAQQQFVKPFGIRSVIGFGGVLPSGDFFGIVLFTRVVVPRAKAELFRPLAVSVKTALLRFEGDVVFEVNSSP